MQSVVEFGYGPPVQAICAIHRQNLPRSLKLVRGLYKGCTRVCTRVEVQQTLDSINLSWCQGSIGGRGGGGAPGGKKFPVGPIRTDSRATISWGLGSQNLTGSE